MATLKVCDQCGGEGNDVERPSDEFLYLHLSVRSDKDFGNYTPPDRLHGGDFCDWDCLSRYVQRLTFTAEGIATSESVPSEQEQA